jgi:hypothetical protein
MRILNWPAVPEADLRFNIFGISHVADCPQQQ